MKPLRLSDNQKWVGGLVLFFLGLYTLYICASYFLTWSADASLSDVMGSAADAVPTGEKGTLGARLGEWLIARGFGAFGIAIPVMLIILGLRMMRYRPAALERSLRITLIGMILGSVSLGLVFGTQWGVFGTGLGGELGIFAAE